MKAPTKVSDTKLPDQKKTIVEPNVPDDTVLKGINAVKKLVEDFQKRKNILFADDTSFLLQIEVVKIPKCPKRKLRLKLPHSLATDSSEICLFVADLKKGKRVDHEPTIHHYEDILKEKGITCIKTVMPVRQLRVEYDQIEMRRRLLSQFDFFLADSRITGILAHKLGAMFFIKNALPTPVKMDSKDLKETIRKALHKTCIRIHGEGDTFQIKIGTGRQTPKEICENVQSILSQLNSHFPGGWENIRSVHIKSPQSMSIPIYVTLKNKNAVVRPKIKSLHAENDIIEGKVTTVMGGKVQVFPNGKVKIIKRKGGSSDDESDEDTVAPNKKVRRDNLNIKDKKQKKISLEEEQSDSDSDECEDAENNSDIAEESEDGSEKDDVQDEEEKGEDSEEDDSEEEEENDDDDDSEDGSED